MKDFYDDREIAEALGSVLKARLERPKVSVPCTDEDLQAVLFYDRVERIEGGGSYHDIEQLSFYTQTGREFRIYPICSCDGDLGLEIEELKSQSLLQEVEDHQTRKL